MAHLAMRMEQAPPSIQALLAGMLLVAFGSKAGLFSHLLLAAEQLSYPAPGRHGLLRWPTHKGGGLYPLSDFSLIFPHYLAEWQPLILAIAGFTMVTGVFNDGRQHHT